MGFGDFVTSAGGGSFLGGALGAGASILGTVANSALSISAAQRNQRYAREQMAWQKEMSDTAHQREVEDLRKAGINPLFTAMGSGGASTPSGQSGSIAQASVDPFDTVSAKDLLKYFDSQKQNIETSTEKTQAEADQTRTLTPVLKEQAESATAKNLAEEKESIERATTSAIQNDYWKKHPTQYAVNQWLNTIGNGVSTIGSVMSMMNNLRMTNSNIQHNRVDSLNKADLVRFRNR